MEATAQSKNRAEASKACAEGPRGRGLPGLERGPRASLRRPFAPCWPLFVGWIFKSSRKDFPQYPDRQSATSLCHTVWFSLVLKGIYDHWTCFSVCGENADRKWSLSQAFSTSEGQLWGESFGVISAQPPGRSVILVSGCQIDQICLSFPGRPRSGRPTFS